MAAIINTKVPGSGTGWMLAPIDPAAMPLPETLETGAESLLSATGSDATTNAGELLSSRLVAGTVAPWSCRPKSFNTPFPKSRPAGTLDTTDVGLPMVRTPLLGSAEAFVITSVPAKTVVPPV